MYLAAVVFFKTISNLYSLNIAVFFVVIIPLLIENIDFSLLSASLILSTIWVSYSFNFGNFKQTF